MTESITMIKPDDWHLHLRDGDHLKAVAQDAARHFGRAIVMPNLPSPVTTLAKAREYRSRIEGALGGLPFQPLMTLYLTQETSLGDVREGFDSKELTAIKLYPQGATTNSDYGVTGLKESYPVFELMQKLGMPLLIHGEVTDQDVDIFDRERVFLENKLIPLREDFPELKIVLEHITTKEAAQYVAQAGEFQAATITAHHLSINRNHLLAGGIRPHHYCLPIVKREEHRQGLIEAIKSGSRRFFLGTDSAPHPQHLKQAACGCAGIYTAHAALGYYLDAFEAAGALENFEAFASFNGPDFYGLSYNKERITLLKEEQSIPESLDYGADRLIPFKAGVSVGWRLA